VNSYVYRLDTPPNINNIFYISLLRSTSTDPLLSQIIAEA
jgi:hypothetical protein